MRFLLPKQSVFFELFSAVGTDLLKISVTLKEFSGDFHDFKKYAECAEKIEHEADIKTHEIIDQLNTSFVTPFDREDVYLLAHELDGIIDRIEDVITQVYWYGFERPIAAFKPFAALIDEAATHITKMLAELPHLKHNAALRKAKVRIHDLEDEADKLFYEAIHALFTGNSDPIDIIKTKDILEELEDVMDLCQEVSNLIEGIVIKSS